MRMHRLLGLSDKQGGKECGIGTKHWDCSPALAGDGNPLMLIMMDWDDHWSRPCGLKLCCINYVQIRDWIPERDISGVEDAVLDAEQGRFLLNLFKTTDDRIACSLISAVDIFEAENTVRDSKYSASQMAIDECALQPTFSHQSMIFHFLSHFFTLSDDVVDCGEYPE